jgi:hypothetical protein
LASLLDNAKSNDWQNSLEINIDESIKKINNYALNATNFSLDLRKTISNSNYKEMFNSGKYDVWIKWQIQKPLEWISDLLETNLISLKKQNNFIEQEIWKQTDEKHIWQLTLAQKRVVMKIEELWNSKRMIDEYVGKLVSG